MGRLTWRTGAVVIGVALVVLIGMLALAQGTEQKPPRHPQKPPTASKKTDLRLAVWGSDAEIATFCSTTSPVTFPVFRKVEVNGDKAVSECTGTATLLVPKEGDPSLYEERWMHSRYLDTWSRRDGKWGLDDRKTVIDYRRISYVAAEEVKKNYQIGARTGRDDPSYKLFGGK